jgi:hypothetical protein
MTIELANKASMSPIEEENTSLHKESLEYFR